MSRRIPPYRTYRERHRICRENSRWPEVGVAAIDKLRNPVEVVLRCGHVTRRLQGSHIHLTSRVLCEQCAAGEPTS